MVDWKSSSIQLIATLAGSSVFLFGVTTIYTDYFQQPQIFIDTTADFIPHSPIVDVPNNSTKGAELKYTVRAIIENHGNTPAEDVVVTCLLEDVYIVTDKPLAWSEEDFNETRKEPNLVTWEMSRLADGSTFEIAVNVTRSFQPNQVPEALLVSNLDNETIQQYEPSFKISAAADQGTEVRYHGERNDYVSTLLTKIRGGISTFAPLIALSAVSVIIIYIPRISDIVKRRRIGNEHIKMISRIRNEVEMVRDIVKHGNSKQILPYKNWYSESSDTLHQIFDNYDDYNKINNFYELIKLRNVDLAANSPDLVMKDNNDLSEISDEILTKIAWSKYLVIHYSVPIAMTIFSAIAVLGGELIMIQLIHIYFEQLTQEIDRHIHDVSQFLLLTITGAIIVFPLLQKILNTHSVFSKSKSSLFKMTLRMNIGVFVVSLIIGAQASIFLFLAGNVLTFYLEDVYITPICGTMVILTTFGCVMIAARELNRSILSRQDVHIPQPRF
jgi:hypothetical protein